MAEDIKDSIVSISKGSSSRNRIGSVLVPHRLRKEERNLLKRAMKYGYIEYHQWSRENILNIYSKLCSAHDLTPIYCFHEAKESKIRLDNLNNELKKKTLELIPSFASLNETKEGCLILENLTREKAKKLCNLIASKISRQNNFINF